MIQYKKLMDWNNTLTYINSELSKTEDYIVSMQKQNEAVITLMLGLSRAEMFQWQHKSSNEHITVNQVLVDSGEKFFNLQRSNYWFIAFVTTNSQQICEQFKTIGFTTVHWWFFKLTLTLELSTLSKAR